MPKKKKKSKGGDARGYGQATVFRAEPPTPRKAIEDKPSPTTAKADVLPSTEEDDWEAAFDQDEKAREGLPSKKEPPPRNIPPPAVIRLPTATDKASSPSTVSFTTQMQTLLDELVDPLPWQSFVAAEPATDVQSDRFLKKIAYIYDYLLHVGFTFPDLRRALETLGSQGLSISLGSVLDWLCYTLPPNQLPLHFLDDRVALVEVERRQLEQAKEENESSEQEVVPPEPEEQRDTLTVESETHNKESLKQPELEKNLEADPVKTKDEERLEELEKSFAEVSLEFHDEASKYMLSKYEVMELEKRYRQTKKGVERLRNKVEAARRRRQEEERAAQNGEPEEVEEEAEEEGFIGGFFDEATPSSTNDQDSVENLVLEEQPSIKVPDDAIPKGWTGQTPKEILEGRCRRLNLSRPTFHKLDNYGCRVVIRGDQELDIKETARFDKHADGQNYVATKALFLLDPTLPIHRSLPPFFRDLWKSWADKVANERIEKELEKEEQRKEQIFDLMALLQGQTREVRRPRTNAKETEKPDGTLQGVSVFKESKEIEDENKRLRDEFRERVATKKYQSMLVQRQGLPVREFRESIIDTVAENSVTILNADTGAGKSTQVPQYLLEHALENGHGCRTSIVCTQPRRVAATSLADRVSEEMASRLGDQVGYSIRLDNKSSSRTRLLFCTTGVILRRLIEDPLLNDVSHVVVDEVHERQWQIDVFLVALRKLISGPRSDLKVILMSATLDAKLFSSFFYGAPLISVPGRTFAVSNYFLEDLIEATGHIVEDNSPNARQYYQKNETASLHITTKGGRERSQIVSLDSEVDPTLSEDFLGYSLATRRTMDRVDESVLNYDLIEDLLHLLLIERHVDHILKAPEGTPAEKGAILVFLPGIGEIRTLCDRLETSKYFSNRRIFDIIPLHSALSSTEQRRAFNVPRKVRYAIIVATNIAETSVTIPDAVCVIDSGRVREIRHDKRTLTRKLVTTWCSRASAKQRAGRAGRVQPGICLRLFSSKTNHTLMAPTTEPELQRLPLEEVCLTILAGRLASHGCATFLNQTPQPPKAQAVTAALTSLEQVGAIRVPQDDYTDKHESVFEQLTPLGLHLAKLPVDCRLGKMLLLGAQFCCVDTIATIVAGLSASQSPFLSSLRDGEAAAAKHARFRHENSDFLTLLNLYNAYIDAGETFSFCRENFVSFSALREMKEARKHYLELLSGMGWLERDARHRNINGQDDVILHAVIAAALSQMARVDRASGGKDTLWHRSIGTTDQQVHVHKSSVNAILPRKLPSRWLVFFEKFATSSRVSINMTAFCSPLSLVLLVGHKFEIQHAVRRVELDGWMEIGLAATTSVQMSALRRHLRDLHKETRLVDGVVSLLKQDADRSALWDSSAVGAVVAHRGIT